MKINKENTIIYGTLAECIDEIWKRIDFENAKFPDFDFAAETDDDYEDAEEAFECSNGWFGVKDLGKHFDADTISLMIAHYGGGGVVAMELNSYASEEELKEQLISCIRWSTDSCGYGVLEPSDYTVFEIIERNEK